MLTKNMPPILENKHYAEAAVFLPENLLREARRQRRLPNLPVQRCCTDQHIGRSNPNPPELI